MNSETVIDQIIDSENHQLEIIGPVESDEELLEIAIERRIMNSEQAFDNLVSGITIGHILNNVGITINLAGLPSWPEYSRSRDNYYGCGFIGRFLSQKLRPFFRPKLHIKRRATLEDARIRMQQDSMNAMLER